MLTVPEVVAKSNNKIKYFQKFVAKSLDKKNTMCYSDIAKRNKGGDEMPKYDELTKLKGRITGEGQTYRTLSAMTNIPLNTLSNKLNGHSLFDIIEVSKLCAALNIMPEEIPFYFSICCVTQ